MLNSLTWAQAHVHIVSIVSVIDHWKCAAVPPVPRIDCKTIICVMENLQIAYLALKSLGFIQISYYPQLVLIWIDSHLCHIHKLHHHWRSLASNNPNWHDWYTSFSSITLSLYFYLSLSPSFPEFFSGLSFDFISESVEYLSFEFDMYKIRDLIIVTDLIVWQLCMQQTYIRRRITRNLMSHTVTI